MSARPGDALRVALANDELDKFLVGEPSYFHEARNDNEEPQNVVAAFDLRVLRYRRQTRDACFPARFVAALLGILASYRPKHGGLLRGGMGLVLPFLPKQEARTSRRPYADLFEVDLGAVALALRRQLEACKAALVADTRWAGNGHNSHDGLWGPLPRTALLVRDRLGGPDFVPADP